MKNLLTKSSLIALGLIAFIPLLAQGPSAPLATPIDGGLSLLLAAGGAYGIRRIYQSRKKQSRTCIKSLRIVASPACLPTRQGIEWHRSGGPSATRTSRLHWIKRLNMQSRQESNLYLKFRKAFFPVVKCLIFKYLIKNLGEFLNYF